MSAEIRREKRTVTASVGTCTNADRRAAALLYPRPAHAGARTEPACVRRAHAGRHTVPARAPRAHTRGPSRGRTRAQRAPPRTLPRTQRAPVADAPARLQLARSAATTAAACPAQFGLEYLARRRHAQPPRQWLRSAVRNGIFGLRHARGRHGRESRSGAHARAAPAARERYDPNWIARPPRRDGMTVMAVDMNLDLIV